MKKLFNVLIVLLAVLVLCACTPSENPDPNDGDEDDKVLGESYVSLDINPSIELIVDGEGKVVILYAKNDDAKVLIAGEATFEGEALEDAVKRITDLCVEYGYLTEDNKDIEITVSSPDGDERVEELEKAVNDVLVEGTKDLSFSVSITTGLSEEMLAEYQEVKAELESEGLVEELTISKFKLMESAKSSDPTLEFDVAVKLNDEELINRIKNSRDEAYNIATTTYNKMVEEVEKAYQTIKKSFERGKYATYYTANATKHLVNYGVLYAAYGSAADTSEAVLELHNVFENYLSNVLTDEQVSLIVSEITKLGIAADDVKEGIKDEEGNVTVASINAYLDEVTANIENEEIAATIQDIKDVLASVEETVKGQTGALDEQYIPQLETMLATLKAGQDAFKMAYNFVAGFVPQNVKASMEEFLAESETLIATIETTLAGEPTVEDLAKWVEDFRAKEAEIYEKMMADLSEAEVKEIESSGDWEISEEFKAATEQLTTIRDEAKSAVEEELQKIKADRKPKEEAPAE